MKNIVELKGNWNDIKGRLKHKFSILTDSDLWFVEGRRYEMLDRIQIKLGKSDEEMRKVIFEL